MLQPFFIPYAPFIDISMDFIEMLPKFDGNKVILVVVDKFSKYTHFMALMHPILRLLWLKPPWVTSTSYMGY